jgi:CheY-like chemotaxis protein
LGGDVTLLHSKPGEGSVFRFVFNAQRGINGSIQNTGEMPLVKHIAHGQAVPRILAVDDDSENLKMLRFMLGEVGFVVDVVTSGADTLKRWDDGNSFDLILMDRRMPGMDGIETIKRLKERPGGRNIPIIMVTANELADGMQELVDGCVLKPLRREVLLMEIQRIIGVQYEFDDEPVVPKEQITAIDSDDLLQVTATQRESLKLAVHSGDIRQMRAVTEDIANEHPGLAAVLRNLINHYDYDELNRLLKQNQGAS